MSSLPYLCVDCGASARAGCNCGARYVPASEYAAKAIADNPGKSNRVIAAETGVSKDTVRRQRKPTGADAPVEKRTGKDGKARKLPERKTVPPEEVNARYRDLMKRFREFEADTNKWVRKIGFSNLEQDARDMMRDGLMVIANELMLLAQKFDGR